MTALNCPALDEGSGAAPGKQAAANQLASHTDCVPQSSAQLHPGSAHLHPATSSSATSPEVCWTQPVTEVGPTKGPSPTDHFSPNELPTRPDPTRGQAPSSQTAGGAVGCFLQV